MILLAVTALLIAAGGFISLAAAVGVLRLPDLFMRMHASTKAGALGTGLLLLSVAVVYGDSGVTLRVLATIVFIFLTAPVAAHAIGRAAYLSGEVALWEGTLVDELAEVTGEERLAGGRTGGPTSGRTGGPPAGARPREGDGAGADGDAGPAG